MSAGARDRLAAEVWAVAALTAVAAVLRLSTLTAQSFWTDEQLSAELARRTAGEILVNADGEAPLHGLLLHALTVPGAASDWWLRLPSALAGIAAVPVLYALGRRAEDRLVAAVAGALLALDPLAIWYAQEARAYALMMLWALASTLAFLLLLERGVDGRRVAAYAIFASLGLGTHYYFVFVLAAHGCLWTWAALRQPGARGAWLLVAVATAVAVAPWLPSLASDLAYQSGLDSGIGFSWFALPYTALVFVGGFSLGPPLRDLHAGARTGGALAAVIGSHAPAVALAVAAGGGLVVLALLRRLTPARCLVLLSMTIPVLGPWLASAALVGYRPRYALSALPFALLWMAGALRSPLPRAAGALLAAVGVLGLVGVAQMQAPEYAREDNRGAAALVAAAGDPEGTAILLVGNATEAFRRYAPPAAHLRELQPGDVRRAVDLPSLVGADPSGLRRVVLVSSRPWTVDPDGRVRSLLDGTLALRDQAHVAGMEIRSYATGGRS